jgi:FkbM family methyltransferase
LLFWGRMKLKSIAYRLVPGLVLNELRHRKHLRDLATAVELEEAEVRQLVNKGDTVLDIGANFGVFTKLFSELVGPEGSVIAFEPIPLTYRTLAAGIKRYHMSNVRAFNKALSDNVGTVQMVVPKYADVPQYAENPGDNLYRARIVTVSSPKSQKTFAIDSVTIDSLQLTCVNFMKIDVEGHELEVLRGSRRTLERLSPTLMVEVMSPRTVDFLCKEMGYRQPVVISPSNQLFVRG